MLHKLETNPFFVDVSSLTSIETQQGERCYFFVKGNEENFFLRNPRANCVGCVIPTHNISDNIQMVAEKLESHLIHNHTPITDRIKTGDYLAVNDTIYQYEEDPKEDEEETTEE